MNKIYPVIIIFFFIMAVQSCSKKTVPSPSVVKTETRIDTSSMIVNKTDTPLVVKKDDTPVASKPVIKRKPKESIPKVIVVNDKYAKKSVDGRYYYDLQGHRYWRNNKDGKYYLFNKSMLTDEAFKKPD